MVAQAETTPKDVISKVIAEARAEILAILNEGFKEGRDQIDLEEAEAEIAISNTRTNKERRIEVVKRKVLGAAEMRARNRSLQLVEETINDAFDSALAKCMEIPEERYERALRRLVLECVEALEDPNMILAGNEKDTPRLKVLAESVSEEKGVKITVEGKAVKTVGGALARSSDGSTIFNNTFEARMNRVKPLLRAKIAEMLNRGS